MNDRLDSEVAEPVAPEHSAMPRTRRGVGRAIALAAIVAAIAAAYYFHSVSPAPVVAPPPPPVTVSTPLRHDIQGRLAFLGQFSAVDRVELRAQVGGTLTRILFKDGDIVHKGDVLFQIDPEPYQIKLSSALAQLESAKARSALATRELARAQELQRAEAGSAQNVDQRVAEQRAAQAAIDDANAQIRDARFDLERCQIRAPISGRMGTHLVSVGNLISGSRAASTPTTLLATIVSMNPIYLDFDMSEHDYAVFEADRRGQHGPLASTVSVAPTGDETFSRQGLLNFVDNTLDRSSGTIHARATISNDDFSLTPGGFARVRLDTTAPQPALLLPDAAVLADQTDHMVFVLDKDNVATPRKVEVGELRDGLRVIRSGLKPDERVIIDGIPTVHPGAKVAPHDGTIQFSSGPVAGGTQS
ncbi:efflux RND transporter periplasmic adaptor subunit [Burkholderia cenocepacia]|uniref:efflux RND transporter periplasmic adaptor subunit n=1 Tax=Burkholderia cenocepacia TaxID=95486 RepID=UPI0009E10385|nr:efflux RND transporter periplasmic adaptor subunit [Burkholderia cenocepacia]ARF86785.1 pytative Co/Zn/Cd efflux system membrane fusion protein [Burkholderia cenocepacia]MCW3674606.1 efflux RND transporter periplasmic adaptor subunit [Burkholderia cenocepacia]MDC6082480.1 efflux RND transporter periplasmic adaptor subunit [Burkholderia cenocepacia]SPV02559.1 efflux transporter RND family MFP subunit [Burkholderia cenocepacia]